MIVFTLCSNNYLAQAKTLGDSLFQQNPEYKFIIGLTDEYTNQIDYDRFKPHTIIPVQEIGIKDFDSLWKKYDIVEFNTCVKASYFKFIFNNWLSNESVIYLDPDIFVYQSLSLLEQELSENDILLTPHIFTSIELDNMYPGENAFLNYGIYNLGFIGLHRNCTKENGFLDWWEDRLLNMGYIKPEKGLFVDQLWINFVPIFFNKVKILNSKGFNMAPWNLHERSLTMNENESPALKDGSKLIFYHFSSNVVNDFEVLSKDYNRYSFRTHPELKKLYGDYNSILLANRIDEYSSIKCSYILKREEYIKERAPVSKKDNKILKTLKLFIPPILFEVRSYFRK